MVTSQLIVPAGLLHEKSGVASVVELPFKGEIKLGAGIGVGVDVGLGVRVGVGVLVGIFVGVGVLVGVLVGC